MVSILLTEGDDAILLENDDNILLETQAYVEAFDDSISIADSLTALKVLLVSLSDRLYIYDDITNGLISYWKLDESSGDAIDAHGSNDGTNTGVTQGVAGKINTGYSFENTGDYIQVPSINILDSVTFAFWYKPASNPATYYPLIGPNTWDASCKWFLLHETNGKLSWTIVPEGAVDSTDYYRLFEANTPLPTDEWSHVAVTYSHITGLLEIYINGVRKANVTKTPANIISYVRPIQFKGSGTGTGILDEIGMWEKVLSAEEITKLYNSGSGRAYPLDMLDTTQEFVRPLSDLTVMADSISKIEEKLLLLSDNLPIYDDLTNDMISYWKMDESSGNMIDSYGSNDGTPTGVTQGAPGKINTAYYFEDDYIYGDKILLNTKPFTFASWVKYIIKPDGEDGHTIFTPNWNYGLNQGYGWQITHINGTQGYQRLYLGNGNVTSTIPVPDNEWHHLVVTHDGTNVRMYFDGVLTDTSPQSLRDDRDSGLFYIGKESSTPSWRDFKGTIDELGIWNRALAQEEITRLYNGGLGLPYSLSTLSKTSEFSRSLTDVQTLAESIITSQEFNTVFSDNLSLSDNIQKLSEFSRGLSDSITINDALEALRGLGIALNDTINLSDALTYDFVKLWIKSFFDILYKNEEIILTAGNSGFEYTPSSGFILSSKNAPIDISTNNQPITLREVT